MTNLLRQALEYAINALTCSYCAGEGSLASRQVKIQGQPAMVWTRPCDKCSGSGVKQE